MELDQEKTAISRIDEGFSFLGFNIKTSTPNQNKITFVTWKSKNTVKRFLKRTTSRKITIYPDKNKLLKNLKHKKFCSGEKSFPLAQKAWAMLDEYQIVLKYRQIIVGLYNYYRNCDSTYALNYVSYILQYSCAHTLAKRRQKSIKHIFKTYGTQMTIKREIKSKKNSSTRVVSFPTYTELKNNQRTQLIHNNEDFDPFYIRNYWRTAFKLYSECCICGSNEDTILHHINSIKKIKTSKDKFGYIRSQINRLQIPVCPNCHLKITNGTYNENSPIEFYNEFLAKL